MGLSVRYRMDVPVRQQRLTREDWAEAALDAIARGGVAGVAVETIAAELGATKGSFYWHFESRDALIQAALDLWEERRTDAVMRFLEREPDPARRLRTVMEAGAELGPADRAEIALLGDPGHPAAARAVRRVARRRIAYISEQLRQLGYDEEEAVDRAVLIYNVYVGYVQMAHLAPRLTTAAARRRQVEVVFEALVAR